MKWKLVYAHQAECTDLEIRTIADLEGSVKICEKHLCEALSYRSVEVR